MFKALGQLLPIDLGQSELSEHAFICCLYISNECICKFVKAWRLAWTLLCPNSVSWPSARHALKRESGRSPHDARDSRQAPVTPPRSSSTPCLSRDAFSVELSVRVYREKALFWAASRLSHKDISFSPSRPN